MGGQGNRSSGYGVRIENLDGTLVEVVRGNQACDEQRRECAHLLAALEWARAHSHSTVHVRSDSPCSSADASGASGEERGACRSMQRRGLLAHEIGRVTFEHRRPIAEWPRRSPAAPGRWTTPPHIKVGI
jgi:hypothetical protein